MKREHFLVTGASGFIGRALVAFLQERGAVVTALVRRPTPSLENVKLWDPMRGILDPTVFANVDVVIHLSGASISRLWTPWAKKEILASRVASTTLLAKTLNALTSPPPTVLFASAVGFYGECGATRVLDNHPPGNTLLAQWCQAWESSSQHLHRADVRTATLRFGNVLSPKGGLLKKLLPFYRRGWGMGLPDIWMSWISLFDLLNAIVYVAATPSLSGPINMTAPHATSWKAFSELLAQNCGHPPLFTLSPTLLRLGGKMAQELLLTNVAALPAALLSSGFTFSHTRIETALSLLLKES